MFGALVLSMALVQAPSAPPALPPPPSRPRTAAEPAPPVDPGIGSSGYVPHRVYDTREHRFVDFEAMVASFGDADVVLVGEEHDDPNTHRLEAAILEGLARRHVPVVLSLEMFERDVQGALDAYLAGERDEAAFLADSRPWPRYATDYRALVEIARHAKWPVVAGNVPRRLASDVAKSSLTALDGVPPADRALAAADVACPRDAYFDRFAGSMTGHNDSAGAPPMDAAMVGRYYESQCLKDETMAESIVLASRRAPDEATVVHVTGAFHSDFGIGTPARVRRRLPDARVVIVTVVPVEDLDTVAPGDEDLRRAKYLLYTIGKPSADVR